MTQITTYEQIIESFNQFSITHAQLNDFGVGPTWEISTTKQMKFPYMWVTHAAPSRISLLPEHMNVTPVFNFTFLFMDKINIQSGDDENGLRSDNQIYIMSDMYQVTLDFIGYLMMNGINLDEQEISIEPIYDETTDKVSGWKIDMDIKYIFMNCVIPQKVSPVTN